MSGRRRIVGARHPAPGPPVSAAAPADPTDERRADVEAFVEEQVGDLDLPPSLDTRLRSRIRDLALGRATVRAPGEAPPGSPTSEPARG